ncbi:hypothetical protein H101_02716 [Trichophyton interdigitale H6]|nr:hypothetical protein H101_02716 [Trichophyton interdigitale H6]
MNPHISVPRQHAGPAQFGGTSPQNRNPFIRMPQVFGRLFKVSQMDFEMAIWEMTSLVIAPKKVFKSMYYHKQTKNTWHRPDPSFSYLFSLFLYLTGLAWGFAYKPSFLSMNGLAIAFVFLHYLGVSLIISTIMYFTVGRIFGPNGPAATISEWRGTRSSLGRMRRRAPAQGLFGLSGDKEHVEFGYCFDISARAFFTLYLHLYVLQFVLLPVLTRGTGTSSNFLATLLGNTLYLSAFSYYTYISFLGYSNLPFLYHTELILLPIVIMGILWFTRSEALINPHGHTIVEDCLIARVKADTLVQSTLFPGKKLPLGQLSDEELLARFTRGFFGGIVFAAERFILASGLTQQTPLVSGAQPTNYGLSLPKNIWNVAEIPLTTLLPLGSILFGAFQVTHSHLVNKTKLNPTSEGLTKMKTAEEKFSYIDFGFGDGNFAGCHRLSVHRNDSSKGIESVAKSADDHDSMIEFRLSFFHCNPRGDESRLITMLSGFHQIYARLLFTDALRLLC